ncbi:DNA ligase 1-like [Forsythia ovata]|uniref:DNA ligase 1-like n=1 Tax=Forsythia ovata TaxID=205694 RepID=A0ABD1T7L5_9LAMI
MSVQGSSSDEAKHATQLRVQNGGKPVQNNLISQELKESKCVLDPDSRIINQKESVSQLLETVSGAYKRDQDAARAAARDSSALLGEDNGQNKDNGDGSKDQNRNELIGVASNNSTHLLKDLNSNAVNKGNIRKRKDLDSYGFLHESEVRPNKLLKEASHHLTENGRKLDSSRTPNFPTSDKQGISDNVRLGKKDQRVNGTIVAQQLSVSKPKPSTETIITNQIAEASKKTPDPEKYVSKALSVPKVEDQIAEASRKPPHPDSKYLSVVLTVPKMEWSEFDDQDWLFSRKDPLSEKPEVGSLQINQERCVWSEAMHVVSADVYALPYVIPY